MLYRDRTFDTVISFLRDGITYAVASDPHNGGTSPNLSFMEILCEFSGKLMRQDKQSM